MNFPTQLRYTKDHEWAQAQGNLITIGVTDHAQSALGDVVFAEPKALIGFAGPRTIQGTLRIELPKGFQTSEFLLEHGFIDRVVRRHDLKSEIARTIDYCGL